MAHLEGLLEGLRKSSLEGQLAKGDCFNVRSIKIYLFRMESGISVN